jgi:membrane associated rhomboid family serine protease
MKNYLAKQIYRSGFYPFVFVVSLWLVFFIESMLGFKLTVLGVLPRQVEGVFGVVTSVFVHGDLTHIASNTIPILVLGMLLFYFYRRIAFQCFIWIWLISGLWLWIGGRSNPLYPVYHIGASTLIYGLAAFLFFSGVFRRHTQLMVVSILVVFMYGSIMWGIFPLKQDISWEGHLFGSIAGTLVAFNYRKEGPQKKIYQWEDEEEKPEEQNLTNNQETSEPPPDNYSDLKIIYHYKPNGDSSDRIS